MKKKLILLISIVLGVIALDQITKGILIYLITDSVPVFAPAWELIPYPYLMTQVCDIFNIVFTWNPGTSFSIFRALGESAPIILILLTGFIIGFIGYYLFMRAPRHERAPLALILGGAIGNLIDRIRFGAVVDFLDFHISAYHWPAFNVADICICVGVAWFLLRWYMQRRRCLKSVGNK